MAKPKFITAKFDSECTQCGEKIKKGDSILYTRNYPKASVLCTKCTEQYERDLAAADFDEQVYNY